MCNASIAGIFLEQWSDQKRPACKLTKAALSGIAANFWEINRQATRGKEKLKKEKQTYTASVTKQQARSIIRYE